MRRRPVSSRRLAHALTDYEYGEIAKPYNNNNKFLLFINILAACDSIQRVCG